MTISLTEAERAYLKSQPLARLATVDPNGAPQNNPVGVFLDEETGDVLVGGHAMGATRKFRNVQANGQVALVVDDLVSRDPWTVRGLEIRGTAVALEDADPPVPFMSREVIRITPTWVGAGRRPRGGPADPPLLRAASRRGQVADLVLPAEDDLSAELPEQERGAGDDPDPGGGVAVRAKNEKYSVDGEDDGAPEPVQPPVPCARRHRQAGLGGGPPPGPRGPVVSEQPESC